MKINIIGAVNNIFTSTKFENAFASFENFGFDIKKIIVHAEASANASSYNTKEENSDSNAILEVTQI